MRRIVALFSFCFCGLLGCGGRQLDPGGVEAEHDDDHSGASVGTSAPWPGRLRLVAFMGGPSQGVRLSDGTITTSRWDAHTRTTSLANGTPVDESFADVTAFSGRFYGLSSNRERRMCVTQTAPNPARTAPLECTNPSGGNHLLGLLGTTEGVGTELLVHDAGGAVYRLRVAAVTQHVTHELGDDGVALDLDVERAVDREGQ